MTLSVGIIGTGNIAPAYIDGCSKFPDDVQVVACADMLPEKAATFAEAHDLEALSIEALLARDDIDLVINLTIPAAHAEVSQQIIAAGKHVYLEKPFALDRAAGRAVLDAAEVAGVRVGCAPDTFLGAGGQTCRAVVDRGEIGTPLSATAFMAIPGHESWHPNPAFYYQAGGGPLFDMGPYYLTALVNLLGPMQTVSAIAGRGFETRTAQDGSRIPVQVDTHSAGTIGFVSGAIATLVMSFDVQAHNLPRIEVYGTEGSLVVPDPNTFGGETLLWTPTTREWQTVDPVGRDDVQRGIGVADMAQAIAENRPQRVSGELAFHVLDAMCAFDESSAQRRHIDLTTQPPRPEPL